MDETINDEEQSDTETLESVITALLVHVALRKDAETEDFESGYKLILELTKRKKIADIPLVL